MKNSLFGRFSFLLLGCLLAFVCNAAPLQAADTDDDDDAGPIKSPSRLLTPDALKGLGPTEAYLKIHEFIMQADKLDQFKPVLSREAIDKANRGWISTKLESENRVSPEVMEEQIFKIMKMMMYPRVKITSEQVEGDKAVLQAVPLSTNQLDDVRGGFDDGDVDRSISASSSSGSGTGSDEEDKDATTSTTGVIHMRLEDGVWKHHRENWHSRAGSSGQGSKDAAAKSDELREWCAGARTAKIANAAVSGKLKGLPFKASSFIYDSFVSTLSMEAPVGKTSALPARVTIFLFNDNKLPYGTKLFSPGKPTNLPHIHLRFGGEGKSGMKTKSYTAADRYGMRLEFDPLKQKGKISGRIVLRIPDEERSEVTGIFNASIR